MPLQEFHRLDLRLAEERSLDAIHRLAQNRDLARPQWILDDSQDLFRTREVDDAALLAVAARAEIFRRAVGQDADLVFQADVVARQRGSCLYDS